MEHSGCRFVCISARLFGKVQTLTAVLPVRTWTNVNIAFTACTYCNVFESLSVVLLFVPPVTTDRH